MARNIFEGNHNDKPLMDDKGELRHVEYTADPAIIGSDPDIVFKVLVDRMAYELLQAGADITNEYTVRMEIR